MLTYTAALHPVPSFSPSPLSTSFLKKALLQFEPCDRKYFLSQVPPQVLPSGLPGIPTFAHPFHDPSLPFTGTKGAFPLSRPPRLPFLYPSTRKSLLAASIFLTPPPANFRDFPLPSLSFRHLGSFLEARQGILDGVLDVVRALSSSIGLGIFSSVGARSFAPCLPSSLE